jgi:hypothetical protein
VPFATTVELLVQLTDRCLFHPVAQCLAQLPNFTHQLMFERALATFAAIALARVFAKIRLQSFERPLHVADFIIET